MKDGIRRAYWTLYDAALEGKQLSENDSFPMMTSPSHVRHCIDLLRQTLMCHSDRTVEHVDSSGGVTGFGVEHQCYDYQQLLELVRKWQ
jgi:hypothetical protein